MHFVCADSQCTLVCVDSRFTFVCVDNLCTVINTQPGAIALENNPVGCVVSLQKFLAPCWELCTFLITHTCFYLSFQLLAQADVLKVGVWQVLQEAEDSELK